MLLGAAMLLTGILLWLRPDHSRLKEILRAQGVRGVVATGALLGIVGTLAILFNAFVAASMEKGAQFEHDRTVGSTKVLLLLRVTGVSGLGVCRCSPDRVARIELPGGFRTMVSIYEGRGAGPRPGVLLIHGNTWLGRRLSTYRLMASLLAKEGYTVVAYDQVGFGQSDDRFGRGVAGLPAAYDFLGQARAALEFLLETTSVDRRNLSVLGHSGGVDVALRLAHRGEDVSRVAIMVAPPPPLEGDGAVEQRRAYLSRRDEDTYRFIHGREWPDWFSWDLTELDASDVMEPFETPGHSPLLLILGEHDEPRGHEAVRRRLFERVAGPKELVLIPGSDHYLNTAQSLGFVFYDRAVARHFVRELASWLAETAPGGA